MLFPEAEVTKSLSNMIKAYSVRYKEELKKIDIEAKEEELHARVADAILADAFVGGLQAIALTEDGEVPAIADFVQMTESGEEGFGIASENAPEGQFTDSPIQKHAVMSEEAMEAWREEERQKLRAEVTAAEKLAMKIEMEKMIRTQADVILEQTRAQGELLKERIRSTAEAEKAEILENARREGYEEGRRRLLQEQEALETSFAERERELSETYEKKLSELEPMAVDVIAGLLQHLTGVMLETRKGILPYLVTQALKEAERSQSFLIKVSKEDFEVVKGEAEQLRALFEREVTLEVVQDALLKKGECMIETDSNIIDCSLGTQLEGLLENIRLLRG